MTTAQAVAKRYPEVGDLVYAGQEGKVSADNGGEVTIKWQTGATDRVTFIQFALSFDYLGGRWLIAH